MSNTDIVQEIVDRKHEEGERAFLCGNTFGDVILWSQELDSIDDDGAKAVARWQVNDETLNLLFETGELDYIM